MDINQCLIDHYLRKLMPFNMFTGEKKFIFCIRVHKNITLSITETCYIIIIFTVLLLLYDNHICINHILLIFEISFFFSDLFCFKRIFFMTRRYMLLTVVHSSNVRDYIPPRWPNGIIRFSDQRYVRVISVNY